MNYISPYGLTRTICLFRSFEEVHGNVPDIVSTSNIYVVAFHGARARKVRVKGLFWSYKSLTRVETFPIFCPRVFWGLKAFLE